MKRWQGEFVLKSRAYKLVIISLILVTLMFDSGVIFKEIRSWSILGVKENTRVTYIEGET